MGKAAVEGGMSLGWRRTLVTLFVSYLVSMLIAWIIVNIRSGTEQPDPETPPQGIDSASAPATGVLSGSAQNTGGSDWPTPMWTLDDAERVNEFKQEPALVLPELVVDDAVVSTNITPVPPPPKETLPEVNAEDPVSMPIEDVHQDEPLPVAGVDALKENAGVKRIGKKSEKLEQEYLDLFPIEAKSPTEKAVQKTVDDPLTVASLEKLKMAYESAYNRGDIKALAGLFDQNVQSNEIIGRSAVLESYQQLFNSTTVRELAIAGLSWVIEGGTAHGLSDFQLAVRQRNSTTLSVHHGKIELLVAPSVSGIVIVRITHEFYP